MLIAALGHLYAFPYKEYAGASVVGSRGFTASLAHALKLNDFYHDTVHQVLHWLISLLFLTLNLLEFYLSLTNLVRTCSLLQLIMIMYSTTIVKGKMVQGSTGHELLSQLVQRWILLGKTNTCMGTNWKIYNYPVSHLQGVAVLKIQFLYLTLQSQKQWTHRYWWMHLIQSPRLTICHWLISIWPATQKMFLLSMNLEKGDVHFFFFFFFFFLLEFG